MPPNVQNRRKEDVLMARMDERLLGLDRSFTAHEVEDHARFELVFGHMKDSFDKLDIKLEKMDTKLGKLWDQNNKNHGAFNVSRVAAGIIWGIVIIGVNWFLTKHGV